MPCQHLCLKKNKKQKANQGLNLELLSNAWRRHYFLPEQKTDSQHFTVPQQALMAHKTCHVVATIIGAKKRWHSVSIFPDVYPRPPVRLNRIFIGFSLKCTAVYTVHALCNDVLQRGSRPVAVDVCRPL